MDKSYEGPSYEQRSQLADLLEKRLLEIGWTQRFKRSTKEIMSDKWDENEKLDIKQIIREVIPSARESVPKDITESFKTRMKSLLSEAPKTQTQPAQPPHQQHKIINQTIREHVTMSTSP